jgi:O-acetyl-ADP-ribose deacetylase (regulator of RNase III)
MMKWLKDVLADAKAVLLAPVTNILCGAGVLLILAAFVEYDKTNGFTLHGKMSWAMAIIGAALAATGVVLFYLTTKVSPERLKLDYSNGVESKRTGFRIVIKSGEIQSIPNLTRNSAIVLPANTAFIDDCATDRRSAMGAFFGEHFPKEIAALPETLRNELNALGITPSASGQYEAGTTIVLPDSFARPAALVVTASTARTEGVGIVSTPHMICSCVEGVLKATADRRIDTVYVPLLGSGHGGVDRGLALMFMVLALLHYARTYHHLRSVEVVIHPKDIPLLNESKEVRQIIAL